MELAALEVMDEKMKRSNSYNPKTEKLPLEQNKFCMWTKKMESAKEKWNKRNQALKKIRTEVKNRREK